MQIKSLTLKQPKTANSPRFGAITIQPQLEKDWGTTFRKLGWPLEFKCYDVDVTELKDGQIGVSYLKSGIYANIQPKRGLFYGQIFKKDQVKDALKWIIQELGITDEFIAGLRKKLSKKANSEIEWPIE